MPVKKRGAKKTAEKEEAIVNESPVSEKTVYNIENKPELKEISIETINPSTQPVLKESPIIETSEKKSMRKEVKVLVILVIILIIIDCFSLYLYYKPDLSKIFNFKTGNAIENPNN